jgi:uncharacterized delta-60 repeat protein
VVTVPSVAMIGSQTVLIQPDGKILVCAVTGTNRNRNYVLLRFNPNGTPDTSFGNNGVVVPDFDLQFSPYKMLLQADNKILVTGTRQNGTGFFAARFQANGAVDTSFGTNGKVVTFLGDFVVPYDAALQPDGKIVLGGTFLISPYKIVLTRYTPGGQPDSSFGTDGKVLANFNNRNSQAFGILIQPNGKILVCGYQSLSNSTNASLIARFNPSGTLDTTFGRGNGYVLTDYYPHQSSQYFDMAFQPDGKLVAVGYSRWDKYTTNAAIARYLVNDAPDFDFDGDGRADVSVFRPGAGAAAEWYWLGSSNNESVGLQFGAAGDLIAPADFDGDGKSDLAVFRPSNGTWYRINSARDLFTADQFGISEDKPVAADYDGDGKTDLAVYRPSAGDWYIINSGDGSFTGVHFGITEDKPAPADFDGDGKSDLAVFRPSGGIWYLLRTTAGFTGIQFGVLGDIPAPNAFIR